MSRRSMPQFNYDVRDCIILSYDEHNAVLVLLEFCPRSLSKSAVSAAHLIQSGCQVVDTNTELVFQFFRQSVDYTLFGSELFEGVGGCSSQLPRRARCWLPWTTHTQHCCTPLEILVNPLLARSLFTNQNQWRVRCLLCTTGPQQRHVGGRT